jgi:nicotinamidase-related amidase
MGIQLDKEKTALLVMDLQKHMIDEASPAAQHTGFAKMVKQTGLLERVGKVLNAARKANMFVGYVVVDLANASMPRYPDRGEFCRIIKSELEDVNVLRPGTWGYGIDERVAPKKGEPVIPKGHVSAFAGSRLDSILRERGITDLALLGVATTFVVTGTVWSAITLGYSCLVIEDCCTAGSQEAHRAAIAAFAPVVDLCSADAFIEAVQTRKK